MERMPVQSAEEFAEQLHAKWTKEMSDRNAGNFGDPDDYLLIRRQKLLFRANTFYLYADQSGAVENGHRCREDIKESP
jgi:hypothetical protein